MPYNAIRYDGRRRRRGFTRSIRGCRTCKIRHVKCNENRPCCFQCSSTGRTCEFLQPPKDDLPLEHIPHLAYASASDSSSPTPQLASVASQPVGFKQHHHSSDTGQVQYRVGEKIINCRCISLEDYASCHRCLDSKAPLGRNPSLIPGTAEEIYCFQFFYERSIPIFSTFTHPPLWTEAIVPLLYSEPIIQDLVLALSSVHRTLFDPRPESRTHQIFHLERYSKVLRVVASKNSDNLGLLLLCMPLLCMYEDIAGMHSSCIKHLTAGHSILRPYLTMDANCRQHAVVEIADKFFYPFLAGIRLLLSLRQRQNKYDGDGIRPADELHEANPTVLQSFSTFADARSCLHSMITLHLQNQDRSWNTFLGATSNGALEDKFSQYRDILNDFLAKQSNAVVPGAQVEGAKLRCDYLAVLSMIKCLNPFLEARLDIFSHWACLVYNMEPLIEGYLERVRCSWDYDIDSSDFGYIAPLFFATCQCRDPRLRRHGRELLYKLGRHEGRWNSTLAAMIAETIITIEEGDRINSIPPVRNRVRPIALEVDHHTKEAILLYRQWPYWSNGPVLNTTVSRSASLPTDQNFTNLPLTDVFQYGGYQGVVQCHGMRECTMRGCFNAVLNSSLDQPFGI